MGIEDSPEHDTNGAQNPERSISEKITLNARSAQVAITPAQLRIVRGIEKALAHVGGPPTAREVSLLTNISDTSVRDHIVHLRRVGVLDRNEIRVVREPTGVMLRRDGGGWAT